MTDGRDTRTRILHAALELVGREGPDGFTASALAKEVGVSKATLFHHFGTLDEIPLAVIEEIFAEFFEHVEGQAGRSGSLARILEGLGHEMTRWVENEHLLRAYFVFLVKGLFDARFREGLLRVGVDMHGRMRTALAPSVGPDEDADVAARMIEVMLDGIALNHLAVHDHELLDRVWSRFSDLLVSAQVTPAST